MTVTKADERLISELVTVGEFWPGRENVLRMEQVAAIHREDAERPLLKRIEDLEAERTRIQSELEKAFELIAAADISEADSVEVAKINKGWNIIGRAIQALGETQ